jgi:hypothetical protein
MGSNLIIVVFAVVVVIGGMGSIMGSIVTGLGLGLIEGLTKVVYPEASAVVSSSSWSSCCWSARPGCSAGTGLTPAKETPMPPSRRPRPPRTGLGQRHHGLGIALLLGLPRPGGLPDLPDEGSASRCSPAPSTCCWACRPAVLRPRGLRRRGYIGACWPRTMG